MNIIGYIYVKFYKNMRGLPICAANKFAELKLCKENRKFTSMEMGVKYWKWIVYMDIAESGRQC
jgi:hypothetical protein